MRKVLRASASDNNGSYDVTAVCEDGTLWRGWYQDVDGDNVLVWSQLPAIPDAEPKQEPEPSEKIGCQTCRFHDNDPCEQCVKADRWESKENVPYRLTEIAEYCETRAAGNRKAITTGKDPHTLAYCSGSHDAYSDIARRIREGGGSEVSRKTDIDDISEMMSVVPECEPYRKAWNNISRSYCDRTNIVKNLELWYDTNKAYMPDRAAFGFMKALNKIREA